MLFKLHLLRAVPKPAGLEGLIPSVLSELRRLLASPISMELGMVVSGIVRNDSHASTASRTGLPKAFKERMERHGVEPFPSRWKTSSPSRIWPK